MKKKIKNKKAVVSNGTKHTAEEVIKDIDLAVNKTKAMEVRNNKMISEDNMIESLFNNVVIASAEAKKTFKKEKLLKQYDTAKVSLVKVVESFLSSLIETEKTKKKKGK